MTLPDKMYLTAGLADQWAQELRAIARELERNGDDDTSAMMYAAASLMDLKADELASKNKDLGN